MAGALTSPSPSASRNAPLAHKSCGCDERDVFAVSGSLKVSSALRESLKHAGNRGLFSDRRKSFRQGSELVELYRWSTPSRNVCGSLSIRSMRNSLSTENVDSTRTRELLPNTILLSNAREDDAENAIGSSGEIYSRRTSDGSSENLWKSNSAFPEKNKKRSKHSKTRKLVDTCTGSKVLDSAITSEIPMDPVALRESIAHDLLDVTPATDIIESLEPKHYVPNPLSSPPNLLPETLDPDKAASRQHSSDSLGTNAISPNDSQQQHPSPSGSPKTGGDGNPLGKKFLGKKVVQWLVKGVSTLANDMVNAETNGQEKFRLVDGTELFQLCQSYLSKEPMPPSLEERCQMAAQHYSTVWDNFQRELQSCLQTAQSAGKLNCEWKDSASWKLLKQLSKSDGHKTTSRSRGSNTTDKNSLGRNSEFELSLIQKNIDDYASKAVELLRLEKEVSNGLADNSHVSTTTSPTVSGSESDNDTDFSDSESSLLSKGNLLANMIAVSSTTGVGGIHLVTLKPSGSRSPHLPLNTFTPGDPVVIQEERFSKSEAFPPNFHHLLQGNVHELSEDESAIVLSLKARYGDPSFSRLFGKNLCVRKMSAMADETTFERNVETLERLKSKGLDPKSPCRRIVIELFRDTLIDMSSPSPYLVSPPKVDAESSAPLHTHVHTRISHSLLSTDREPGSTPATPSPISLSTTSPVLPSTIITPHANSTSDLHDSSRTTSLTHSSNLDASQTAAVTASLDSELPVVVIQGPPGTGKSTVITDIVVRSVTRGERVLVSAQSNAAVDNLVERLSEAGLRVVRIGNPVRVSPAVSSKSLDYQVDNMMRDFKIEMARRRSDLKSDLRRLEREKEGKEKLKAGIKQVLRQLAKQYKQKEKETIDGILGSAQVVLCTLTGAGDPLVKEMSGFDLTVLDEAAQATEPASWAPITLAKRAILAGDTCQLAPVILSREAQKGGLGVSLMERVSRLPHIPVFMLKTQHRMNTVIAEWTSKEIYAGLLTSSTRVANSVLCHLPNVQENWFTSKAMIALDTRLPRGSLMTNCEEAMDVNGTGSYINEGEADIVISYVLKLIDSGLEAPRIVVQSPYLAQVQLLKNKMDKIPQLDSIEVASVDSFQGREADAVILSMVRSNPMRLVGFLSDERRMNVAITRARRHVAIVCDSTTVSNHPFLHRLLLHVRSHGQIICADRIPALDLVPASSE